MQRGGRSDAIGARVHMAGTVTVIGIDPGLADTGIGIVEGRGFDIDTYAYGRIQTSSRTPLPERLHRIHTGILNVLQTRQPGLMVIEDVFSLEAYPKSGIMLGKVCGVILLAGSQTGIPTMEIPVREAKQVLTGNGNSGKRQLERAVRSLLGHHETIRPDHASDALALAIIGLMRYGHAARPLATEKPE